MKALASRFSALPADYKIKVLGSATGTQQRWGLAKAKEPPHGEERWATAKALEAPTAQPVTVRFYAW